MDAAGHVMRLTGATSARAASEGHQSRVFELVLAGGRRAVAKVLDASLVDAGVVLTRVETVADLADLDPRVCRPIAVAGRLVSEMADEAGRPALVLCYEFAAGVPLDVDDPRDAALMGSTLAGLHRSLARLTPRAIPEVAALRAVPSRADHDRQLLHGDFNSANLRRDGSAVRVFDFEDCGYGPRSFEIANAVYMVAFAASLDPVSDRNASFEEAFLDGYAAEDGREVDRAAIDGFLDLRVRALARWLDDPHTAPIGIRTATPQWHRTLRSFVDGYTYRRPE